jgi:hypothetical protein
MSAERALLIRTSVNAESGRYFAVGMDVPSVRVFDTATGELCCLVEPDKRKFSNNTVLRSTGSLTGTAFAVSLSCMDMAEPHSQRAATDVVLAAGLSDGTLLLHNVTRDAALGHIAVSDSQQSILSVSIADGVCLVLVRGGKLYVVDIDTCTVVAGPFDMPKTSSDVAVAAGASGASRVVFVSGPTSGVHRLLCTGPAQFSLETILNFSAQATPVNFSWISADASVAITCGAQEGVVRVWDLILDGKRPSATCKRTLPAGHRVGHMRVFSSGDTAIIAITTFLGQVLLWDLGSSLVPKVMDPMPLEPSAICVSKTATGKLLLGDINPVTKQLITVRGRFAVPRFEGRSIQTILEEATSVANKTCVLPLASHGKQSDNGNSAAFAVDLDNEWASHHAVATRALVTAPEAFVIPKAFHALSVAQLPTSSNFSIEAAQHQEDAKRGRKTTEGLVGASLGSITMPLYQALHAGDESLVMELMSVSSRSDADVASCISALQLPYVLHLLKILSKRTQASNARSPVFQWISAIIQLRGAEMYAAQQERRNNVDHAVIAAGDEPKAFVAPLLAQYRNMTAQYDKLAMAYGRLSIFRSVNPTDDRHGKKKRNIVQTETAVADGVVFPRTFRLIDRDEAKGGPKVIRMRSKLERQAMAARRKRTTKKPRREDNEESMDDAGLDESEDDDDLSLNSEEMDAMLMEGELSLVKRSRGGEGAADTNLIAEDDSDAEEAEGAEDFDEMSDDVVDSDEESEGSASEVDSSIYEEGEDAEGSIDAPESDDDDADGDEDEGAGDDDDEDVNYSLNVRADPNEQRLRTD